MNKCRKNVICLKKLNKKGKKIKKWKKKEKREKKENSTELQKPSVESEICNNNRKCD